MTQAEMLEFWDDLWTKSMWYPALDRTFADLTAKQALWKPQAERNSIWQHLNHLVFWREVVVNRVHGKPELSSEIKEKKNFEEPSDPSEAAWREATKSFERSQKLVHDAIADGTLTMHDYKVIVPHDAYHAGQVMLLRAMQGLEPTKY